MKPVRRYGLVVEWGDGDEIGPLLYNESKGTPTIPVLVIPLDRGSVYEMACGLAEELGTGWGDKGQDLGSVEVAGTPKEILAALGITVEDE